ncbi:hypothetical protein SPSIL_017090 [Sporomusa silvacetica DSM 10669]|uniref:Uncharacterized protein n=1 Tax=Sporomusa silvacetica DSM 10669 TaxID=1123289 RepID=A0ABZ3IIT0_9FIRM|nr:hypothetical protein [Sporomusa silvacetica]OZC18362.1 hypothetical protein SPSIL_25620 [Sporomusa silvacetica DSM 10669]
MSIKTRLDKLEQIQGEQDDELRICVNIVDGEGRVHECENRRDGCRALPCDMSDCWMDKPRSGVKVINIDVGEDN